MNHIVGQSLERFSAFNLLHRNSLLESEPPTHGRLRKLVSAAFGRGHVQRLRPWVAQRTQTLVGQLAERIDAEGSADLLTTLAAPLPIELIAELLGISQPIGPCCGPGPTGS